MIGICESDLSCCAIIDDFILNIMISGGKSNDSASSLDVQNQMQTDVIPRSVLLSLLGDLFLLGLFFCRLSTLMYFVRLRAGFGFGFTAAIKIGENVTKVLRDVSLGYSQFKTEVINFEMLIEINS